MQNIHNSKQYTDRVIINVDFDCDEVSLLHVEVSGDKALLLYNT